MIPSSQNFQYANAQTAKFPVHVFSIAGYERVFTNQITRIPGQYPWIMEITGGDMTANEIDGTASLGQVTVKVIDRDGLITADLPGAALEGSVATISTGFAELSQSDFITTNTMVVDKIELTDFNNAYNIVLRDPGVKFNNTIYGTADDGYATAQGHTKTLLMNPMALMYDVLVNQLGYLPSQVNTSAMNYYEASLFPGFTMDFTLNYPVQAQEFLNTELFKALYGYGFWNYAGQFTPYFFTARGAPTIALALTPDNIISPLPVTTAGNYYDVVDYRMDYDGQNFWTEIEEIYGPGVTAHGLPTQQIIQSKGLRSPLGGGLYARMISAVLFQRYGYRPVQLDVDVFWTAVVLELGDLVTVTHPLIKNILTGSVGMTNEVFEVQGVTRDYTKGTVSLKLLDVNYRQSGPFEVAPNGTPSWTGSTPAQQQQYMYIASAANSEYSTGQAGNAIYP